MGVIAGTGWRWDEVDNLTLHQVKAMNRYWQKHPPTHLLVAAYMGYGSEEAESTNKKQGSKEELIAFARQFGANVNGA